MYLNREYLRDPSKALRDVCQDAHLYLTSTDAKLRRLHVAGHSAMRYARDTSLTWGVDDLLDEASARNLEQEAAAHTPLKLARPGETDASWKARRRAQLAETREAMLAEERARIAALRSAPISEPAPDLGIYAIQPRAVASADRVPELPPLPEPEFELPTLALHEAMAPAPRQYGATLDIFAEAGIPVPTAPRRSAIRR